MKSVKDPIYGYIEIDSDYFKFIDDAAFQRLRNLRQTGYQALYPSAGHNRFVHSLGVYHLGTKAIRLFHQNLTSKYNNITKVYSTFEEDWPLIKKTFLTACLLHDVGHSPFSHTGERFYTRGIEFKPALSDALASKPFSADLKAGKYGKEHEAMSALIGLDLCNEKDWEIDKELFVRSIIGLQYTGNDAKSMLQNAVITLLNGDLIDVDKLDYIVRDAFVTGFSSMAIDIDRLLAGLTVCFDDNDMPYIAYQRKSISVIENVFYANDLERRWVQNHPIIIYDCKLIEFAIQAYDNMMTSKHNSQAFRDAEDAKRKEVADSGKTLTEEEIKAQARLDAAPKLLRTIFLKEALTANGLSHIGIDLKLLCDDDITSGIKNGNPTTISEQLFSRGKRYKPLWKTEVSFESLLRDSLGDEVIRHFQADLKSSLDYLQISTSFFINGDSISQLKDRIAEFEETLKGKPLTDEIVRIKNSYATTLSMCKLFEGFAKENDLPDFEFAAVVTDMFKSTYRKPAIGKIKIELSPDRVVPLTSLLQVKGKDVDSEINQKLFYIYTTAQNLDKFSGNSLDLGYLFVDYIRRNYKMVNPDVKTITSPR